MMKQHGSVRGLSRRRFLGLSALSAASVLMAGCSQASSSAGQSSGILFDASDTGISPNADSVFLSEVQALQGDSTITLLFLSDIHFRATDKTRLAKAPTYLEDVFRMADELKPSAIITCGDIVDGKETMDVYHADVSTIVQAFSVAPVPVIAVRGNHDDNSYYTQNVTRALNPDEVASTSTVADELISPLLDEACVHDQQAPDSCYYYRDLTDEKLRVIVLDGLDVPGSLNDDGTLEYVPLIDFGFGSRQVEWLAGEALHLPEDGWGVIVCAHINFNDDRPYGLRSWGAVQRSDNDTQVWDILKAFSSGTSVHVSNDDPDFALSLDCDFSTLPAGKLLCCLNGHIHRDACTFVDGVCNMAVRAFSATDHACFSAVVIDRETGFIHTRAFDTVSGISPDWDLDCASGTGVPEKQEYYRGQVVVDGATLA